MRKELFKDYFEGKKVTVLGLGLLGRGVGDTVFIAEQGADVICSDDRSKEKLSESIEYVQSKHLDNLRLRIGEHHIEDFENRDYILTCAGMPLGYSYLEHAKQKGIPVYMSASLVVDIVKKTFSNVTVIGVTGTRGKSTTTELVAYILEQSGKRVHRGGNIRGMANLPLLEVIEEGDYVVLELDSWQLQGFGDMKISPDIAVFTSFLDDHLNYYKNDREIYFSDKANIFINQEHPCLIASVQAAEEIKKRYPQQKLIIPEVGAYQANIIGEHNDVAISLALAVAEKVGIDHAQALMFAKAFPAVHGRLEKLGIFRGVTVYNDNNATTPDAVIAGVKAINDVHKVKPILIMGGADKNLTLELLEKTVRESTKTYVLLSGTGTEKLSLPKDAMFETLSECIQQAFALAEPGDVIIFSPGFASFSKYFNNEYERNDLFVSEVQKYA